MDRQVLDSKFPKHHSDPFCLYILRAYLIAFPLSVQGGSGVISVVCSQYGINDHFYLPFLPRKILPVLLYAN